MYISPQLTSTYVPYTTTTAQSQQLLVLRNQPLKRGEMEPHFSCQVDKTLCLPLSPPPVVCAHYSWPQIQTSGEISHTPLLWEGRGLIWEDTRARPRTQGGYQLHCGALIWLNGGALIWLNGGALIWMPESQPRLGQRGSKGLLCLSLAVAAFTPHSLSPFPNLHYWEGFSVCSKINSIAVLAYSHTYRDISCCL